MSPTALFVGDAGMDLTLVVSHVPQPDEKLHVASAFEAPGGVVANAAVASARAGASVRLLLQLGTDANGAAVREGLNAAGLAVEAVTAVGRTCHVVIMLEPHGEKRLLLDPGVSMYPSLEQVEAVSLDGVSWVHTAPYGGPALRLAARCRIADIPLSFDLEPAVLAAGIAPLAGLVANAAVVFCNERAAQLLGDDPRSVLFGLGARAIVLTLGARGLRLLEPGVPPRDFSSPVRPAVRDTTGAGDCLAGWFVALRLAGCDTVGALATSVAAAALSCERAGAQISFPTRPELDAFMTRAPAASNNLT